MWVNHSHHPRGHVSPRRGEYAGCWHLLGRAVWLPASGQRSTVAPLTAKPDEQESRPSPLGLLLAVERDEHAAANGQTQGAIAD